MILYLQYHPSIHSFSSHLSYPNRFPNGLAAAAPPPVAPGSLNRLPNGINLVAVERDLSATALGSVKFVSFRAEKEKIIDIIH